MAITSIFIRKVKHFLYDLFRIFKYSMGHTHAREESDKILIYIDGRMGDILMDGSAVKCLVEYYQQVGKRIYFIGPQAARAALGLFMSLQEITYIPAEMEGADAINIDSVEQFLKTEYFDKIIIITQWEHLWILNLIACSNCNESWEVISKKRDRRLTLLLIFLKCLHRDFTNRIVVDREMHQTDRSKQLLTSLGIEDFKTSIAYIPKTCDFSVPRPYTTVSVDSNDSKRRWQAEKFIQLIRLLLDHGNKDIYLTGIHLDDSDLEKYEIAFQNENRVKNRIGKLQLKEWVELIRGSDLLIGVDSGAIHVAASVGTKSICLTGAWDGGRVIPYQRDIHTDMTQAPVSVMRSDVDVKTLPCYGCLGIAVIGYGNEQCLAECKSHRPCLCLQAIEVEDVWKAVRSMKNM